MINGLGFSEVAVILFAALLFFGSKELPAVIKNIARFWAKIRLYYVKVMNEINDLTAVDIETPKKETPYEIKKKLRKQVKEKIKNMGDNEKLIKSQRISNLLFELDEYKKAKSVMVYVSLNDEVKTDLIIDKIITDGKNCIVPYCKPELKEIGIAKINGKDDLIKGNYAIYEPKDELRNNFLKSDIELVIVPAVAFDMHGMRLGRGEGYYDRFLKELKNRIPVIGLAYNEQILDDYLPFEYHDVPVDKIITEDKVISFDS